MTSDSANKARPSVVIAGCGYVGRRVASAELARGERVAGIVKSDASAKALASCGVHVWQCDFDTDLQLPLSDFRGIGVYWFAPPPPSGRQDTRVSNFLTALASSPPAKIVAISTTGVYGDCEGRWVNEDEPLKPAVDRSIRRADMEQQLRVFADRHDVPLVILRVPGIYGPGRLPLDRIRRALPVLEEAASPWSNRVHVDDLVAAAIAAADHGVDADVFNVADGAPSTMTDYFHRVADAAGLPRCPEIGLAQARETLSAGMLSYLAESKRIDISRLRNRLNLRIQWQDLDAGLRDAIERGNLP